MQLERELYVLCSLSIYTDWLCSITHRYLCIYEWWPFLLSHYNVWCVVSLRPDFSICTKLKHIHSSQWEENRQAKENSKASNTLTQHILLFVAVSSPLYVSYTCMLYVYPCYCLSVFILCTYFLRIESNSLWYRLFSCLSFIFCPAFSIAPTAACERGILVWLFDCLALQIVFAVPELFYALSCGNTKPCMLLYTMCVIFSLCFILSLSLFQSMCTVLCIK